MTPSTPFQTILVAEDRQFSRKILTDFLEARGFSVLMAMNGQECIRLALTQRPSLILLDLSIPVIDGWEIARLLKSNPATREIPIIATTAHTLSGDREQALAAGCDDYLPKPLDHGLLFKKMMQYLGEQEA